MVAYLNVTKKWHEQVTVYEISPATQDSLQCSITA